MASDTRVLYGFHAVGVRLKMAPDTIVELYVDPLRRDARMKQFLARAHEAGLRVIEADGARLAGLAGGGHHQGVVARVRALPQARTLDDVLDQLDARSPEQRQADPPLLLALDGVTDPHNLGACLRVADGAGVHAVIAPKDRACGLTATVAKVASGAAETVPYLMVTNLSRTLQQLQQRGLWVVGTADDAPRTVYEHDWRGPRVLVMGAEGSGMRPLVRRTCDELVAIPMRGAVESLNVSVATAVCLYEAVRQRLALG
ncbi:MAG: 23S rRNA (guanosine(2251)-2'-O)-methyltransferase RlmB [Tepidimonas ignava]|jgi:23S rRNA (guanosine2251-2'-O)-methyltransferase|uniref:23S rRNA (guanosine-2'-O-)-methyltransferase RlmB n=1 Tax=Tepidimonas ignava TaxID=114249 RepID=A0A4V2UWK3_9BURK|nr:23S rRNA (guanosine(2251)-2'-O)-methyltransferase RlmB [Tepidimonas ignava]MCX7815676.1 23S rRNA (guanosine(2251)-2'-O)-methyltransferase RlmB [Tepidimonas ignava]TCS99987.1 23S rRNA Gm-2251 2'-O-methyltransferase [Tepidimonas ignava]TSE19157.1 23S rRNA (guanosine-2'-O-)-methyltransferase RlmB [Tepidimonas ignava]